MKIEMCLSCIHKVVGKVVLVRTYCVSLMDQMRQLVLKLQVFLVLNNSLLMDQCGKESWVWHMQDYQRYTIIGCIFPACMSLISYTWYMIAIYISCRRFLELCAGGSGIFCQSWSRVGKLRQKLRKTKL